MSTVSVGSWVIEYDAGATARAPHAMRTGAPEECGCADCLRFSSFRGSAYPAASVELLRTLEARHDRETETYYLGETSPGHHRYGGWFHVIGRIVSGPDSKATSALYLEPLEPPLAIGFARARDLAPQAFAGHELVQIEFETEIVAHGSTAHE